MRYIVIGLLAVVLITTACNIRSIEEQELDDRVRLAADFLTPGDWEPSDSDLERSCQLLRENGWDERAVWNRLATGGFTDSERRDMKTVQAIISQTHERSYCDTWTEG